MSDEAPSPGDVPSGPLAGKPGAKRISDGLTVGAAFVGFFGWIAVFWVLAVATGSVDTQEGTNGAILWASLVALLLCAVAVIVVPRTRRLGQGLLLGFSIGFIVGGGLCIPFVLGTA